MTTRLFGTDGVRGVANAQLTPELAFRLGEAAGHFLAGRGQRGRIVVGRDTRRSGTMLEAALVAGITSSGADALLAGVVPTPAVAFLVRELAADGGVVISASHNPPEYNGIKLFSREGFKLPDDLEDEIENFCTSDRTWERPTGAGVGCSQTIEDAAERYVAHAVRTITGDLSGLKVAVDCGHGAAAVTTPEALRRLGAEVVAINCDWTGDDINVDCGSTHLGALAELVRREGFDFGIAHDGDADRMLAVDERGEEVDGDQIMALCAVRLAAEGRLHDNVVVSTVMANLGFEVAMRERGINFVKTKVGDRYVLEQMRAGGYNVGGEQSGHIILSDFTTTGDGFVAALQVLAVVQKSGKPVSQVCHRFEPLPQVMKNVRYQSGKPLDDSKVKTVIASAQQRLNGQGRLVVRPSGTEPVIRVMGEGEDRALVEAVVDDIVDALTKSAA